MISNRIQLSPILLLKSGIFFTRSELDQKFLIGKTEIVIKADY